MEYVNKAILFTAENCWVLLNRIAGSNRIKWHCFCWEDHFPHWKTGNWPSTGGRDGILCEAWCVYHKMMNFQFQRWRICAEIEQKLIDQPKKVNQLIILFIISFSSALLTAQPLTNHIPVTSKLLFETKPTIHARYSSEVFNSIFLAFIGILDPFPIGSLF